MLTKLMMHFLNLIVEKNLFQNSFSGVYGEAENKFVFSNVVVGEKAKARFKIVNPSKVDKLFHHDSD